jgi:hypothetical protein
VAEWRNSSGKKLLRKGVAQRGAGSEKNRLIGRRGGTEKKQLREKEAHSVSPPATHAIHQWSTQPFNY